MSENGHAPKIVASFVIILDEAGNCSTKIEGQFPGHVLALALEVQKAKIVQQILGAEMQARAQAMSKRVLMPDGTVPPQF